MMFHSEGLRPQPNVELSRELGSGSYGVVYKAKLGSLPCAAKRLYDHFYRPPITPLLDHADGKCTVPVERFEQEIRLLESIRHPNIVLYLGVHHKENIRGPLLLMELMDGNLTNFLNANSESIAYQVQLSICHDVIQALAFLHGSCIVHRDLSSNNILMQGNKAKVSDFGMAKIIDPLLKGSCLTTCPGTTVYMPPEALEDNPQYTAKIDCFSFGVVVIQILTRQYPKPGKKHKTVHLPNDLPGIPDRVVEVRVKEVDRRQNHIEMIDSMHPLLSIVFQCLKDKPDDRPRAQDLCEMIQRLTESPENIESVAAKQSQTKRPPINSQDEKPTSPSPSSCSDYFIIESPQSQSEASNVTGLRLRWKSSRISAPSKMFRYSDAVFHEGIAYFLPADTREIFAYNTLVTSDRWSHHTTCQFVGSSLSIINDQLTTIGGKRPDTGYRYNVNTTGGYASSYTDKLYSYAKKQDGSKAWIEKLPAMPTRRAFTTALNTGTNLIVVGGVGGDFLSTVEVLNTESLQWLIAQDLPQPIWAASATICAENMYLLGGHGTDGSGLSAVYTCSLKTLLQPENCRLPSLFSRITHWIKSTAVPTSVWSRLPDIPVVQATCVTVRDCVVVVGGRALEGKPTTSVLMYDQATSTWTVVDQSMPVAQYLCFVFNHTDNTIVVVGGKTGDGRVMNRMNIAVAL